VRMGLSAAASSRKRLTPKVRRALFVTMTVLALTACRWRRDVHLRGRHAGGVQHAHPQVVHTSEVDLYIEIYLGTGSRSNERKPAQHCIAEFLCVEFIVFSGIKHGLCFQGKSSNSFTPEKQ
jgi:hypothetical protein